MFDLDPVILAWCAFALFCGGAIKGTLGIGTPLLTVPMMSLVLPIHMAVTIMAVPVVVANLWQTIIAGRAAYVLKRFWPVLIAVLCGTYVGTKILSV
ncbi:MAG: sulfite exporter TauE/SafE family protein, partial [Gammaproteobacteria bacterium]|nr:sulfite exporter TauE/SafE family protein [Gammaproteobacteria bacterium]